MKKILLILIMLIMPITIHAFSSSGTSTILMEENSGRILYAKNIHDVRSVASISKIMTAVVALENGNLDKMVIMDEEILKAYGSAIYIKVGEEMKLLDLVYGLMLRSGNDAALAIAKEVGGSVEGFVEMMNSKAKEIGMKHSEFNNPSGLDNEKGNYSTAYDMAVLTKYAMGIKEYEKIVQTKNHRVKTNMNYYEWHNKNKLLNSYKYTTGGKTGYTEIAKRTLVTTASNNNLDLIVVTLNNGNDFLEHRKLYDEAFENYNNFKVLKKGTIDILDETYYKGKSFYIKNNYSYPLSTVESSSIYLHIKMEKKRSYKENDTVGVINVMIGDEVVHSEPIYVKNKVSKIKFWEWIKNIW